MRITAIAPVLNEAPWIGYSILAALPYFHEFIYTLDSKSDDGTNLLLGHIKGKYAHEKLIVINYPTFHPHDMLAYNKAFNVCVEKATGDQVMFLHPDMILTAYNPPSDSDALAWWTKVTSYAGDFQTKIVKGRADKWKNIHARKFGLHYFGGYGSQNEDFYHSDITGKTYKHYGSEFSSYPFKVADSGISLNHYCELKDYQRRLEKMRLCLKTQNPTFDEHVINDMAIHHPRVTLEGSNQRFGRFQFEKTDEQVPEVITKHKDEFESFLKEPVYG